MKRKLITLMMVIAGVALFRTSYAVELFESGAVEIHGFISQGYILTDENNFLSDSESDGSTQFNEIGINFGTDVSERLRVGVQFFARDLGKMGNREVTIDWAFADYSFYDWLNLRAGKVKLPYALYNSGRDVDMLRTFVFLPQSVYFEAWRDSVNAIGGGGFYGYIPAGFLGNFEYQLYSGNSDLGPESGGARLLRDQTPVWMEMDILSTDVKYTHTGQFVWDSFCSLDSAIPFLDSIKFVGGGWGLNFDANAEFNTGYKVPVYSVDSGTGDATLVTYGDARTTSDFHTTAKQYSGSLEMVVGNLVVATEYMTTKYDITLDGVSHSKFDSQGYYGSLTYRFFDWLEVGTYYSEYYPDTDDKDGKKSVADYLATNGQRGIPPGQEHNQWSKVFALALRFDITSNWVFKLEGQKINGSALMYTDDGNMSADGLSPDFEEDWHLFAAKISFNF